MALNEETQNEIQELTWALADDSISSADVKRLEELLMADPEARKLYVQCMQMQADLHLFFNPKPPIVPTVPAASPVLTNLPVAGTGNSPSAV